MLAVDGWGCFAFGQEWLVDRRFVGHCFVRCTRLIGKPVTDQGIDLGGRLRQVGRLRCNGFARRLLHRLIDGLVHLRQVVLHDVQQHRFIGDFHAFIQRRKL